MKYWHIDKGLHPPCLMHQHVYQDDGHASGQRWVCTKLEGFWRCARCKRKAPEEIAFIADLAGCYTYLWAERLRKQK